MAGSSIILAVDCNQRNLELLAKFLDRAGYRTIDWFVVLEEFAAALDRRAKIGMALVDISGFDRRIWECCEQLRNQQIPFLVLSPKQSAAIQQESLCRGARSMLVKPLTVKELLGIVSSLLGESE
ncbi:MAG: response regulator [Microcoleus sp. SM1_3_4]|nr:response regulator [Microcoleus sp. SM1_3_4]